MVESSNVEPMESQSNLEQLMHLMTLMVRLMRLTLVDILDCRCRKSTSLGDSNRLHIEQLTRH